jgi:hypothetical protein
MANLEKRLIFFDPPQIFENPITLKRGRTSIRPLFIFQLKLAN